jgi:hypothetical protein
MPFSSASTEQSSYLEARQFRSPVTGESFVAYVLKGSLGGGLSDFDGCPHPPINTFDYLLVIDPVSGYVEYPQYFEKPSPFSELRLKELLGEPKFGRSHPDGLPWSGAYGWEKFENAALLAQAAQSGALTTGNNYLRAAWAVRLDFIGGNSAFDEELRELFDAVRLPRPRPGDLLTPPELQAAEQLEELWARQQLADVSATQYALALAWLYRSRGELKAALDYLAMFADQGAGTGAGLADYMRSSIALEREYMLSAIDSFTKAANSGEVPPTDLGSASFILGELQRRCGNLQGASYWYGLTHENNLGAVASDLLARQTAAAAGRGY